jgi:hypothetical protein
MSELTFANLVAMAILRDGEEITPCVGKESLRDCVDEWNGAYVLWYNLPSGTTHVVKI